MGVVGMPYGWYMGELMDWKMAYGAQLQNLILSASWAADCPRLQGLIHIFIGARVSAFQTVLILQKAAVHQLKALCSISIQAYLPVGSSAQPHKLAGKTAAIMPSVGIGVEELRRITLRIIIGGKQVTAKPQYLHKEMATGTTSHLNSIV